MKTKEMIEQVEAMGFEVERLHDMYMIIKRNETLAVVKIKKPFAIDTNYSGFNDMPEHEQKALYNILDAYARTAIPDREDEPKHYYRVEAFVKHVNYLVMHKTTKDLFVGSKSANDYYKTQFTQSEINKMSIEQQKLFEIAVKERVDDADN